MRRGVVGESSARSDRRPCPAGSAARSPVSTAGDGWAVPAYRRAVTVAGPELLDSTAPPAPRGGATGWVVGVIAVALLLAGVVALRPTGESGVALRLVAYSGSALDGQRFVRLYFSVAAYGGDADVQRVELVLGDQRQRAVPPGRIGDGGEAFLLVDVVPRCPQGVRALPAGTLELTYRAEGGERVARLPLPVEGSLPRLVARRCAG